MIGNDEFRRVRKRSWQVFWILSALQVIGFVAWIKFVEHRAYPFSKTYTLDADGVEEHRLSGLAWGHYEFDLTDSSAPPRIAHSGDIAVELISESGEMVFPKKWASSPYSFGGLGFPTGVFDRYTMRVTTVKGSSGPPKTVDLKLIGSDVGCADGLAWIALVVVLGIVFVLSAVALGLVLRFLSPPQRPPDLAPVPQT
jgi:hypothetical protein